MNNLYTVLWLAVAVAVIAGWWKMFEKAGEAGWKSLVPLYNSYLYFRIAGRNGLLFLLMFVPVVNIIVWAMVSMDAAKHFGKSSGYGILALFLFPFWGALELGFGEAKYLGPKHD